MAIATRLRKAERYEDDEFFVIPSVPIFDEHVGRNGEKYDRDALQRICDNCNDRIDDTGDYCPLVVGHTPVDEAKIHGAEEPDIIGYAGPFRMVQIGKKRPRWAIAADFRIRKDREQDFTSHPRRSVEIVGDDPASQFFDPIALLGAETPKRDLGVYYAHDGARQRYEVAPAFASSTNVFIPSAGGDRKKRERNSQETGAMPLDEESLKQVCEAMDSRVGAKIDQALAPILAVIQDLKPPETELGATPGAPGQPGATPPGQEDKYAALCKYADNGDMDGAQAAFGGMTDDDKQYARQKYEADDDEDRKKKLGPIFEKKDEPMPTDEEKKAQYARDTADKQRYERLEADNRDTKQRYARLEAEHKALQAEVGKITDERRTTQRYGRLKDFEREGVVLNVDDEIKDTESYSDEQFDRHCDRVIKVRYARVPLGSLASKMDTPRQTADGIGQVERAKQLVASRKHDSFASAYQEVLNTK